MKLHERMLATSIERRLSPIAPEAAPIFVMIGLLLSAEIIVIAFSEFHIGTISMLYPFLQMCALALIGMFVRWRGFAKSATFIEAIAIPPVVGVLAVTATVFLASVSAPFVDAQLDAADELLGFDFEALAQFYRDNPRFAYFSRLAYVMFAVQSAGLFGVMALCGAHRRLWIVLNAWVFALLFAVAIFPIAPAAGPFVFHGIEENVFGEWSRLLPYATGPAIEALRDGTMRDVTAAARGLVSIPSFHAVAGTVFIWAAWPSRLLRWPVTFINLGLIGSTVVTGSHYLIDVICGIAVGIIALAFARHWINKIERERRTVE